MNLFSLITQLTGSKLESCHLYTTYSGPQMKAEMFCFKRYYICSNFPAASDEKKTETNNRIGIFLAQPLNAIVNEIEFE